MLHLHAIILAEESLRERSQLGLDSWPVSTGAIIKMSGRSMFLTIDSNVVFFEVVVGEELLPVGVEGGRGLPLHLHHLPHRQVPLLLHVGQRPKQDVQRVVKLVHLRRTSP